MKKILGALVIILTCISAEAETGSFQVKGDIDKYYPVTFNDANFNSNMATELELGRSSVHIDASFRGALIAKFRYHTYNWGHAANFIDADIRTNTSGSVAISNFVGGWTDVTSQNNYSKIVIWLRGGSTTYYYNANATVAPVVFDGVQSPLPYEEKNASSLVTYATHTYKTLADSYVSSYGATLGNNLTVNGTTYHAGKVGIGTNAPVGKLNLDFGATRDNITVTSDGDAAAYSDFVYSVKTPSSIATTNVSKWCISHRKDGYFSGSQPSSLEFYGVVQGGGYVAPLAFKTDGDVVLASPYGDNLKRSGNVGIGTIKPTEKLSVNGTVLAKKVRVSQAAADWPDYVFDSAYQLPSLDEVSLFIKENKHLPDMPSASVIEKEGHDLGDVQSILLKKIEEITLYMIEQNKLTKQLAEKNEKLEKKVKDLESIIAK